MISANSLIVTEIEGIVQKEWNDEQRVDIRTSREAVRHAQGNLIVAESKIKEQVMGEFLVIFGIFLVASLFFAVGAELGRRR